MRGHRGFLCIGSGRETIPLPLADAAAKGVATTTFAMLTPEAVLCNRAWSKLVGPEPFSRSSRGGAHRILAVRGGSVRDPLYAATRSWARSGPMTAAPTVVMGLLDTAATAAAPRRGSEARKNVLVERVPWQGTTGRSLRSDSLASTYLRSAGAEAPLVRERSTVTWAIVDRHQGYPTTSASVDRRLALGR